MSTAISILTITICLVFQGVIFQEGIENNGLGNDDIVVIEKTDMRTNLDISPERKFFVENLGQWDNRIAFVADTDFGRIGICHDSVLYDLKIVEEETKKEGTVVKYDFPGSRKIEPSGTGQMVHMTNYFKGNNPDEWITGARSYEEIIYKDLWPGIDMKYHFDQEGLKYDLVLNPGSRVEDIRIRVEGHDRLSSIDRSLNVHVGDNVLEDSKLDVFYLDDKNEMITSKFIQYSKDTYGFSLSDYSTERSIVIDPLITSTYLGGSDSDKGLSVDLDEDGNIFVAGCTSSSDFPVVTGSYDTTYADDTDYFISKFDKNCSNLIFSTYIGGTDNDGYYDNYIDVVEDGVLMAGTTKSSDFPTTTGCYDDSLDGYYDSIFLKLNPDGDELIFSSYLGGSGNIDTARGIYQSSDGNFFVYGYTYSSDFPVSTEAYMSTMSGSADGFISKFNQSGKGLLYSSFFGGSSSQDNIYHLLEDSNNDIIVAGPTYSSDFPTTSGAYSETLNGYTDGFVTRFNSNLSDIISSTLFGGSSSEKLFSMIIDNDGNIVVVGDTYSDDFPLSEDAVRDDFDHYSEGYVISLKSDLSEIVASTYIGGDSYDTVTCIEMDLFGNYIIAGYTSSSDMNTTQDADNSSNSGHRDGFVSILNKDLSTLEYSTYYGGSSNDSIMGRIAMDPYGKAVFIGYSSSNDLPVLDSYQETYGGSTDCFIFMIDITPWLEPIEVNSVKLYEDVNFNNEISKFDIGQKVFIEMNGTDANTSVRSGARIIVEFPNGNLSSREITLIETRMDSGLHRGTFRIPLSLDYFSTISFTSWKDTTKVAELTVDYTYRPSSVSSVSVHMDRFNISTIDKMDLGQNVIFRVRGIDSNPSSLDKAFINLTSDKETVFENPIVLTETGLNTGEYIGVFKVPNSTQYFENVTLQSVVSPSVRVVVMVHTPIQLRPLKGVTTAIEDEEYRVHYWNFGYRTETWDVFIAEDWLKWDQDEKVLHGTPDNTHIYPCEVRIEITDGMGHTDRHEFQIEVINTPPEIINQNRLFATEGQQYYVDYNSTDDAQGDISWSVIPDNSWFSIDKDTGILSGTPNYDDDGKVNITVTVVDGNGGIESTSFILTVINVNQPPRITTTDITRGRQGERYQANFDAIDPDEELDLYWELYTDANFLSMNNNTGVLTGTPGIWDVGTWLINITVMDSEGSKSSHEYELLIENVNDKPIWEDVPVDTEILHGTDYYFDASAFDPDIGDEIEYSVWTTPESDLKVNMRSGEIEWTADYTIFDNDKNELEVNLKATDNNAMFSTYVFNILVNPTESPRSSLIGPQENMKTSSQMTQLTWTATDPEGEPITYWVYLSENRQFVEMQSDEALYVDNYGNTTLPLNELEQGKTYYWTVKPFDQCTFGTCKDKIFSFRINNIPKLANIPLQKVNVGNNFNFKITGTDDDTEDSSNLVYKIISGPRGMEISETTGTIQWKPGNDQVGIHTVVVSVGDGLEESKASFEIEVKESEEDGSLFIYFGMAGLAVLFIIIIILQIMILTRKKPGKEEEVNKEEITKEIRDAIKETADDLENVEVENIEETNETSKNFSAGEEQKKYEEKDS